MKELPVMQLCRYCACQVGNTEAIHIKLLFPASLYGFLSVIFSRDEEVNETILGLVKLSARDFFLSFEDLQRLHFPVNGYHRKPSMRSTV